MRGRTTDHWLEQARTDFSELVRLRGDSSVARGSEQVVPLWLRCVLSCCEIIHWSLAFFARPGFFGGGLCLVIAILCGSPTRTSVLYLFILVCVSGIVLWTKQRKIWQTWRSYLQMRYAAKAGDAIDKDKTPAGHILPIKATLFHTLLLCASVVGTPFACRYVLSGSAPLQFVPQATDAYIVPTETSSAGRQEDGLPRDLDAQGDRFTPKHRDLDYSRISQGFRNGVIVCAILVGLLVRWLNKKRW